MDGTEVGILEETSKIALSSLLKSKKGSALEAKLGVDPLTDSSNEALEGGLSKQESGCFLVSLDFSDGNCAGSEPKLSLAPLDSTISSCGLLASFIILARLGTSGNALLRGWSLS